MSSGMDRPLHPRGAILLTTELAGLRPERLLLHLEELE
jgi:hypothetical protein